MEPSISASLPTPSASPATPQAGGLAARWGRLSRAERAAAITFVAGLLFRLVFVLWLHPPAKFDYSDMHSYIQGAKNFADLNKPTDSGDWYYPTGTSSWIALCLLIFGKKAGLTAAAVLQGLLSGIEIPLVFVAARRFFGEKIALASSILFATHYLSIGYSGLFMSENYLTIGLIAAFALFVPEKWTRCLAAGVALGIGAWAKSQAFLLAPLWALVLLWKRQFRSAVAVVVGCLAVVLPVSAMTMLKTHQPAFISTNGGQTFALGQCPIKAIAWEDPVSHGRVGFGVPDLYQRAGRGEVEASWGEAFYNTPFNNSKFYMHEGFECIKRYPRHALRMVFMHTADIFAGPPWSNVFPWPDSHTDFWFFSLSSNLFLSYLIAPLAFFGLWRKRRDLGMHYFFSLPFLSLLASSVLFHGDPRFRAPYDFTFFMAGAVGFVELRSWWRMRSLPAGYVDPYGPLDPSAYVEP